jgi:hypothetical protein
MYITAYPVCIILDRFLKYLAVRYHGSKVRRRKMQINMLNFLYHIICNTENSLTHSLYPILNKKRRTSELIPLCHPLPLEKVNVDIKLSGNQIIIECHCSVTHKTGVEMEALMGASIAALTIYDMLKALSHHVTIENTKLIHKSGGKREFHIER